MKQTYLRKRLRDYKINHDGNKHEAQEKKKIHGGLIKNLKNQKNKCSQGILK